MSDPYCYLYSFPFWLFVDRREQFSIRTIEWAGWNLRIYPPFRSGRTNFVPMPPIRVERIPYREEVGPLVEKKGYAPQAAAYPIAPEERGGEYTATIVWGANDEFDDAPPDRYFPMDSMRIDAWASEVDRRDEAPPMSELLDRLRAASTQWWIGKTNSFLGYHTAGAYVSVNGASRGALTPAGGFRTGRGDEVAVGREIWNRAIDGLERQSPIPTVWLRLLDARYQAAKGDVRRAVLDSAIGCEEAIQLSFERIWPEDVPFKKGRAMKGDGLPDYLDEDVSRLKAGRSYAEEHPDRYRQIVDLWNARGNIAHGGPPVYHRDGERHRIDADQADELEKTVEHCVDWLESLNPIRRTGED